MSCDYPIICKWWDVKNKAESGVGCTYPPELFISGRLPHPCEAHQELIDEQAEREFISAALAGDKGAMDNIRLSPFTNFGK